MKTTFKKMKQKIENAYNEYKEKYQYVGLRFEDKEREIGEICENSKHNPDREDPRDFPDFNSKEYENLPEFNGTSAWDLSISDMHRTWFDDSYMDDDEINYLKYEDDPELSDNCYVIAGNETDNDIHRDYDEIIIKKAKVVEIIF